MERFKKEKVNVLIGTQMVAKGLDLPDVTLVGVLDADLSLYTDSFRAAETTFNMLTQVVGRSGRGDASGQALIQTMVPQHSVINLAAAQDYDGFYEMEIRLRRAQDLPPFVDLATITFTGEDEAALLRGATKFRDSLVHYFHHPDNANEAGSVLGPAPCAVPKINYNYRYRLSLRCHITGSVRQMLSSLLRQFAQDRANRGVSVFIDINGFD